MAREIIHAGLANRSFIENATEGYEAYAASVEPFTLEEGERLTGVPADVIRDTAHAFARADRAMICWTLGITEHHNAVDNVLCADQPRASSPGTSAATARGSTRCAGRTTSRAAATWARFPNKLPGFQDLERDADARARFEAAWGVPIQPDYGWHLTQMFHGMERGELRTLYVIGENPAQSEADIHRARKLLSGLDFLIVQDILFTKTAAMADVVFPSSASWCEAEGTVDELRAARAALPQGARSARRGDATTSGSSPSSRGGSATTGAARPPRTPGTSCARSAPMHAA